ncbi:MAG: hypothetical protein DRJ01_03360 [Bacteroidetes bacterium]|nr:MAG: hypothetical protein DRJ01_03360 [Bacteroidota bacterium]
MFKYSFYILFILFIFSTNIYSQNVNVENPNGYNIFYYGNKQISSEGMMKDGKPEGLWKSYYVNGNLKSIGKWYNNQLDSVWCFYNEEGLISSKINYLYGKKNGYYYNYDFYKLNDTIISYIKSEILYLNNIPQGKSNFYYKNGNIHKIIPFKEGKKHGKGKEFAEDGRIISLLEFNYGNLVDIEKINRFDSLKRKHGVWKEFYRNGKVKIEKSYIHGKLNGLIKNFDLKGELVDAQRYENGILVDDSVSISNRVVYKAEYYDKPDKDGKKILKSSGSYVEGKPVGEHREYDSEGKANKSRIYDIQGNLIGEGKVNEDGEKTGLWKFYYSTKELKSKGKYSKNKKNGKWNYYYKTGKIEQKGVYSKGKLAGNWKWYFPEGTLQREENFYLGKEDGDYIEYNELGEVIAKGLYIDGEKEGKWFYKEGDHTEEGSYQTNNKNGIWKYYYLNGKLYFKGKYTQGSPEGKHIFYYKNGKIKKECFYIMGMKEKSWKEFDYYGTLVKTLTFKEDRLLKIDGVTVPD